MKIRDLSCRQIKKPSFDDRPDDYFQGFQAEQYARPCKARTLKYIAPIAAPKHPRKNLVEGVSDIRLKWLKTADLWGAA